MLKSGLVLLAVAAGYPSASTAQQSGWEPNQVNATMCYWEQLRGTVLKDTWYLDGGNLWWIAGLSDGSLGAVNNDGNPLGLVYTLNFSTPFNTSRSQNVSAVLGTISKVGNGLAANNIAPNYLDGAMLGNDDEWFLYGGLLRKTDAFSAPHSDDVTAYQAASYGVDKPAFRPGFLNDQLPSGMTRYVAYGGAAHAPSENKAWYFSGLRSPSWGEIYEVGNNDSLTAVNVSNTLITLDMSVQQQEQWTNTTLPDFIHGRANPELVWVPVGEQGILVALGGVVYPEFVSFSRKSANEAASEQQSPKFMATIDVYDIASGKWYQQPATGPPPQLTRGCAVVAPAQDGSSFSIYWYGGYDGLHPTGAFNDDVWILSLPSFMWMKVYSGKPGHGRAGHKCVMPYPDQMFVMGGYASLSGAAPTCLDTNILQVYNLTSGTWLSTYDPNVWGNYGVPDMIFNMIGGSETGGATMTSPSPTGWATAALGSVFATKYPTKIPAAYPYTSTGSNSNPRSDYTATSSSGIPSWVPPLLGVICGLMFLSAVAVAILLYRRRRLLRSGAASEAGTDDNGNRVFSWLRAQGSDNQKAPTVTTTTEDTPLSPEMGTTTPVLQSIVHHEMADTQVAELMDTSQRVELQDTGLTPVEIINKHSHFAQNRGSVHNSSHYSSIAQADHASSISYVSGARSVQLAPTASYSDHRPDSPPLGTPAAQQSGAAAGPSNRGASGVSGLSEHDRAHLRQISDTTISSVDTSRDRPVAVPETTAPGNSPLSASVLPLGSAGAVSPPTPYLGEGDDYMIPHQPSPALGSGPATNSPLRRSVFHESQEDMGGAS